MNADFRDSISRRDVYRILFRHRRKAVCTFLLIVSVGVAITCLMARSYRSESKLFVRLGRENIGLDATATLGQSPVVAIPQSREAEINSMTEILRSRALREKVVDAVGAAVILEQTTVGDGAIVDGSATSDTSVTWSEWLARFNPFPPQDEREQALARLERGLDVEAIRNSDVVVITYEAHSPRLAQLVLDRLTGMYLDEHMRLNRTAGAQEFLEDQADRLRSELRRAEDELARLKNQTGLISPEAQRSLVVTRIGRLEDELLAVESQAAASRREVEAERKQRDGMSPTQTTAQTSGLDNKAADAMREQLYLLQVREREMAAKYTDAHPELQRVREQLAAAQRIHNEEKSFRTTTVVGPNRAFEETQLALLRHEPALASLDARADSLRGQLVAAREEVKQLNDNELRIATLEREIELQDANYRKYADNLEQAKIDQSLKKERISNINVVQPASYNPQPVRPKVLINLVATLCGGMIAGIGLALVCEYMDHTFKSPEEIESILDLPMLVMIPEMRRRHLLFNGRN